jgi:hypothetical protein
MMERVTKSALYGPRIATSPFGLLAMTAPPDCRTASLEEIRAWNPLRVEQGGEAGVVENPPTPCLRRAIWASLKRIERGSAISVATTADDGIEPPGRGRTG